MSTELHRIAILVIGILSTYVSGLDRPHRAGDTADTHARAHRDAVFDQHAAPDLYAVPNGYASPDSDRRLRWSGGSDPVAEWSANLSRWWLVIRE